MSFLHREVSAGAVLRTSVLSALGVHRHSALTADVGLRLGNNQAHQCVKSRSGQEEYHGRAARVFPRLQKVAQ